MSFLNKLIKPVFSLLMLDTINRMLPTLTSRLPLPVVAQRSIDLTFTLFRLKIAGRFTKGLPYGIGTIANMANKISALQIAFTALPDFFNPANYLMPASATNGEAPAFAPAMAPIVEGGVQYYSQSSLLGTTAFNIGDFVEVIAGVDSGRQGSITAFNGSLYTISGIQNAFTSSEIRRV